ARGAPAVMNPAGTTAASQPPRSGAERSRMPSRAIRAGDPNARPAHADNKAEAARAAAAAGDAKAQGKASLEPTERHVIRFARTDRWKTFLGVLCGLSALTIVAVAPRVIAGAAPPAYRTFASPEAAV